MKILAIIASIFAFLILLVLLLLLFGKVGIRILYRDKVRIKLVVFGIHVTLYSPEKKEKKKRLADCRNPDRALKKERRRQKRRIQRERAKERKKAERKKQHQKESGANEEEASPNIKENLDMILALLKRFRKESDGRFELYVHRFYLRVGGKDAAEAAIRYGVAVQSASCLLGWIDSNLIEIKRGDGAIVTEPNFFSSKTTVDVDIRISIRLRALLVMGLHLYSAFLKERKRAKLRAIKRVRQAEKTAQ